MATGDAEIPEDVKTETEKISDHGNDVGDQNEKDEVKDKVEKRLPVSTEVILTVQHEDSNNSLSEVEAATQKTHEILEERDHQESESSSNGRQDNAEVINKNSFLSEHARNNIQYEELSYTMSEAQATVKENQEDIEEVKQGSESEPSNDDSEERTGNGAEDIMSNVETVHIIYQGDQNDSTIEADVIVKPNSEITGVGQEKKTDPDASGLIKNLAKPNKEEKDVQQEDTSVSQKEAQGMSAESREIEQGKETEHRENYKEGNTNIAHISLTLSEQATNAIDHEDKDDSQAVVNALHKGMQESTKIVDDRKETTPSTNGGEENTRDLISTSNKVEETQTELGNIDSQENTSSRSSKAEETQTEIRCIDSQDSTSNTVEDIKSNEVVHSEERTDRGNEEDTTEKENQEVKEDETKDNNHEEITRDISNITVSEDVIHHIQQEVQSDSQNESDGINLEKQKDTVGDEQVKEDETRKNNNEKITPDIAKTTVSEEVRHHIQQDVQSDGQNEGNGLNLESQEISETVHQEKENENESSIDKASTSRATTESSSEEPIPTTHHEDKIRANTESSSGEPIPTTHREDKSSPLNEKDETSKGTQASMEIVDDNQETTPGTNDGEENTGDVLSMNNKVEEIHTALDNIESQENTHSGICNVEETQNTGSGSKAVVSEEVVQSILEEQLDPKNQEDTTEKRNEESTEVADRNESTPGTNIDEESRRDVIPSNNKVEETQTEPCSIDSQENISSGSSKVEETQIELRCIDSQESTSSTVEDIMSNEMVHSEEQTDQGNEEDTTEKENQEEKVDHEQVEEDTTKDNNNEETTRNIANITVSEDVIHHIQQEVQSDSQNESTGINLASQEDTVYAEQVKEDETRENNNEKITTDIAKTSVSEEVIHLIQQEVQSDGQKESNGLNLESQEISQTVCQEKENETKSSIKARTSSATEESSSEEPIPTTHHGDKSSPLNEADETSKATQARMEIVEIVDEKQETTPNTNDGDENMRDVLSMINKVEETHTALDNIESQENTHSGSSKVEETQYTSSGSKDVVSEEVVQSILEEQLDPKNQEDTAEKRNEKSKEVVADRNESTPGTNIDEENTREETKTGVRCIDSQESTSSTVEDVMSNDVVHSEEQTDQGNEDDTTEKENQEEKVDDEQVKEDETKDNNDEEITRNIANIIVSEDVHHIQQEVQSDGQNESTGIYSDSQEVKEDGTREDNSEKSMTDIAKTSVSEEEIHHIQQEVQSDGQVESKGLNLESQQISETVHQEKENETESTTDKASTSNATEESSSEEPIPITHHEDKSSPLNEADETSKATQAISAEGHGTKLTANSMVIVDSEKETEIYVKEEIVNSNEEKVQEFDAVRREICTTLEDDRVKELHVKVSHEANEEPINHVNTTIPENDEIGEHIKTYNTDDGATKGVDDLRADSTPQNSNTVIDSAHVEIVQKKTEIIAEETALEEGDTAENFHLSNLKEASESSTDDRMVKFETAARQQTTDEGTKMESNNSSGKVQEIKESKNYEPNNVLPVTEGSVADALSKEIGNNIEEATNFSAVEPATVKLDGDQNQSVSALLSQKVEVDGVTTGHKTGELQEAMHEKENETPTKENIETTASVDVPQGIRSNDENTTENVDVITPPIESSEIPIPNQQNELADEGEKVTLGHVTRELPKAMHTNNTRTPTEQIKESDLVPFEKANIKTPASLEMPECIESENMTKKPDVIAPTIESSESPTSKQEDRTEEEGMDKDNLVHQIEEQENETPTKENIETTASVDVPQGIRSNDENTTENVDVITPPIESSEIPIPNQQNELADEGEKVTLGHVTRELPKAMHTNNTRAPTEQIKESDLVPFEKANIKTPASLEMPECIESENMTKNPDVIAPTIESSESPTSKLQDRTEEEGMDKDTLVHQIEEQVEVEHEKENELPNEKVRESKGGSLEKQNLETSASVDLAECIKANDGNKTMNTDAIIPASESSEIPISKEDDNGYKLPVSGSVKPIQDPGVTKESIEVEPHESSQVKTARLEVTLLASDLSTYDITEEIIQKESDSGTSVNSSLVEVILRNIVGKEDGEQQQQEKTLANILMESNETNKTANEDESSEVIICNQVVAEDVTAPLEHENNGKLMITNDSHDEDKHALLDLPVSQFLLDRILRENSIEESGVTTIDDAKEDVSECNISSVPEGAISDIKPDKEVNPDTKTSSDTVECKDKSASSISIPEDGQHENVNEKAKEENQKDENDLVRELKDSLSDEESIKCSDNDYKEKTTEVDKQRGNSLDETETGKETPADTLNTTKDQDQHDHVTKKHEEEHLKNGDIVIINSSVSIVGEAPTHGNSEIQEKISEPVAQDGSPSVKQETNEETLRSSLSTSKDQPDRVNKKKEEEEDTKDRENLVTKPVGVQVGEEPVQSSNEIGEIIPELVKCSFVAEELQREVKEVAETEASVHDSETDDMHQNKDYRNEKDELPESKASNLDPASESMPQSQDVNAQESESKALKCDVKTDDMQQTMDIIPEIKSQERELDASIPPPKKTGDDATPKKEPTEAELEHGGKLKANDLDILGVDIADKEASPERGKQENIVKVGEVPREILALTNGSAECKGDQFSKINEETSLDVSYTVPDNSDSTEVKDKKDDNSVQANVVTAREETVQLSTEETPDRTMGNTTDEELKAYAVQPSTVIHESVKDQVASDVLEEKVSTSEKGNIREKELEFVTKEDKTAATKDKTFEEHLTEEYEIDTPLMVEIRGQPKPVNKKHQNKLSEVGSKMKHSIISKVKKAITCTSSNLPA